MDSIGKKIKDLRLKNNLTQAELGKKIGVTYATISKYEKNEISIPSDTLKLISKSLNVSSDYLLGMNNFNFAKILKYLRVKNNKTQNDLAIFLNVAPQTIYKYENNINEPDILTLKKIAKYFNVSVDYLTGNNNNFIFKNTENLSNEDKNIVQTLINRLNSNK